MFRRIAFLVLSALAVTSSAPTAAHAAGLFGLLDTGELYRSLNGGATWTIHATLPVTDAVGLAASTSASDLMIITRSGSVYGSSNGGANWTGVGAIAASDVVAFTILPDSRVLALTESGTIYESTDGGVSFTGLAVVTASNCVSLTRGPLGRLYVLTRTGELYESQNGGTTWTPLSAISVPNAVTVGRKVAELFVLTETGEVYRSLNYGVSWLPIGAITASNMSVMVANGSALMAGARTGEVYQSSGGASWTAVGTVNQLNLVSMGTDEPLATGVAMEETAPAAVVGAPYPNPARAGAGTFPFTLNRAASVRLELYDVRGRLIDVREGGTLGAGPHAMEWTPSRPAAGRYLVRYLVDGRPTASASWAVLR